MVLFESRSTADIGRTYDLFFSDEEIEAQIDHVICAKSLRHTWQNQVQEAKFSKTLFLTACGTEVCFDSVTDDNEVLSADFS